MNNLRAFSVKNEIKRNQFSKIVFSILFLLNFQFSLFSQGPCDCAALNSTNLCNGGYFANRTAAAAANNPYIPGTPLSWSVVGSTHTFCTKYTAPAGVSKIGLMNFITSGTSGGTSCSFTRGGWTAFASGCSSPISGTAVAGDANSYEFPVKAGVEYRFCLTVTLTGSCQKITSIENYLYTAATATPPSGCTSTIGTIAVTGATANGAEWDLSPGTNNLSLTASGYVLPTDGGIGTCVATYGYFVFDQVPTLPFTDITTIKTQPGFKGISTGVICTDGNTAGKSTSVTTAGKLWFIPFTADCKKINVAAPGNILDIDANADACYAIGTTPIIINYLSTTPVVSCGTCATPTCPISSATGTTSANGSSNLSIITNASTGASDPISYDARGVSNTSYTNYHTITVTNSNQILGMKQLLSASTLPSGLCATRTYELKATCAGAVIAPNLLNANGVSSGMNPEWNNLPAGTYILSITTTSSSPTCKVYYSTTGYYLVNLPVPPCPVDQTFIALDWTQANPFVAFPSTTYTCNSGPQTIWKNVEATIGTPGKLQAFPGFQMEMTTNASASTNSSALVSVNGVPYSYYGPAGTAPAGVLDWGPMAQSQSIIEPYIPAGATVTILIKDLRTGAQSFPYTVYDHSTGAKLTSGTAAPRLSTPITITFTLSSPTMTWKLDGGTANIINNNNGSATFNPSNLTSGPHSIEYTWTNNAGCLINATQAITVGATTPAPTTSSIAYCQGAATVPLTVTLAAGCTQNWYSTNKTGGTAVATAPTPVSTTAGPTTYYVSQTNTATGCESPRTPLEVTINSNPTLVITDPATVCMPATVNIENPTVTAGSTAGGNLTYWLENKATLALPLPAAITNSGQYFIKSTIGSCSTISGVTVLINNCACPYNIVVTNPSAVCSPGTVDITAPAVTAESIGGGTLSYYEDLAKTISITTINAAAIDVSKTYYIYGDNGVCNDIKPVVVTINTTPSLLITNPAAVCAPITVNITTPATRTGSTGGGTLTYWTDLAATSSLSNPALIAASGTYYIQSANGSCTDIEPVVVTVNLLPNAVVTSPVSYCQNAQTAPLTTAPTNGSSLNWYQSSIAGVSSPTTPTITSTTVGVTSYYVTQTDVNGCESVPRSQIDITINAIPVVTVNSPTICKGESAVITANGANSYTLQNGLPVSNPYIDYPLENKTYTLVGDLNGCKASATASVIVNPSPTLVYVDNLAICNPETVDLTKNVHANGSTPGSLFNYYTSKSASIILTGASNISTSGKYYIQASLNGCNSAVDSVVIVIDQRPIVNFSFSPTRLTTENSTATFLNTTTGGKTYEWKLDNGVSTTEISPVHKFSDLDTATFNVKLIATSEKGCVDSINKNIHIFEDLILYIPNSFTPDELDDVNKTFYPVFTAGYDKKDYSFLIFNRWGEIVFKTDDVIKGWDGTDYKTNKKMQEGVYSWKINFGVKGDDTKQVRIGKVNLIR